MYLRRFVAVLAASMLFGVTALGAQESETVDGEVVAVPVVESNAIVLDGDLGDWATLPAVVTNDGPAPSTDPATSGQMRWQIAANDQTKTLYVAATITDDVIIAGRNGDNYWNEDSIEVYVNFGDPAATTYGDGVAQITISAVDRGNTDPGALSLSGNGAPDFDTSGFVFATTAGWGFEIAISLDGKADVVNGGEFGIQIQANGSSGEDRDLKISWSNADVDDTSFQDPSVFGRGVFLGGPDDVGAADDSVDEGGDDDLGNAEAIADDAPVETGETDPATEVETTAADTAISDDPADNEPEPGRTLLIAAIISAGSILIGGLWFERRRKRSEAKHTNGASTPAATGAASSEDQPAEGTADEGSNDDIADEEFDAMITSILDED